MATAAFARTGFLSPYRVLDLTDERGLIAGWMLARLGADVVQVDPSRAARARAAAARSRATRRRARTRCTGLLMPPASAGWPATSTPRGPGNRRAPRGTRRHPDRVGASGCAARVGLDHAAPSGAQPALIHVSITPFGSNGPKADMPPATSSSGPRPARSRRAATTPTGRCASACHRPSCMPAPTRRPARWSRCSRGMRAVAASTSTSRRSRAPRSPRFRRRSRRPSGTRTSSSRPKAPRRNRQLDLSGSRCAHPTQQVAGRRRSARDAPRHGARLGWLGQPAVRLDARGGRLPEEFHDWDWVKLPARSSPTRSATSRSTGRAMRWRPSCGRCASRPCSMRRCSAAS